MEPDGHRRPSRHRAPLLWYDVCSAAEENRCKSIADLNRGGSGFVKHVTLKEEVGTKKGTLKSTFWQRRCGTPADPCLTLPTHLMLVRPPLRCTASATPT